MGLMMSWLLLICAAPFASGEMRKWARESGIMCTLVLIAWGGTSDTSTSRSAMPMRTSVVAMRDAPRFRWRYALLEYET
jgi:hypothetical protein